MEMRTTVGSQIPFSNVRHDILGERNHLIHVLPLCFGSRRLPLPSESLVKTLANSPCGGSMQCAVILHPAEDTDHILDVDVGDSLRQCLL